MTQPTIADIEQYLRDSRKEFTEADFSSDYVVHVLQCDGTTMLFASAFAEYCYPWFLVFTAHHGYHYFHQDEVTSCRMFEMVELPTVKVPSRFGGPSQEEAT